MAIALPAAIRAGYDAAVAAIGLPPSHTSPNEGINQAMMTNALNRLRSRIGVCAGLLLFACAAPALAQNKLVIVGGIVTEVGGAPVETAIVEMSGGIALPTITLNNGFYLIIGVTVPNQKPLLRFSKTGFIQTHEQAPLPNDDIGIFQINTLMKRAAATQSIDTTSTSVVAEGTTRATIEPGDLVAPNGAPVTGLADVALTPIDPSGPELALFPSLNATKGGQPLLLESFAAVEIGVTVGGQKAQIAGGKTMRIEFPIADDQQGQFTDGQVLTDFLWSLNETTGVWEEGLSVTVGPSTADPTKLAFFGEIPHMSRWNCDKPVTTTCLRGKVVDAVTGEGIAQARVLGEGADYNGESTAITDSTGAYCINVKRNASVKLSAKALGFESQVLTVATPNTARECSTGNCQTVENLLIDPVGRTACISGKIYNKLGLPPIPPAVIFTDQFTWTQTDAAGRYCMAVKPAANVRVQIVDPSAFLIDGESEATEVTVNVPDVQGRCGQSEDNCVDVSIGEPFSPEDLENCGQCGTGMTMMTSFMLAAFAAVRIRGAGKRNRR